MKSSTRQYLYSVCRQAAHEFTYFGKKFVNFIMQTPLPRILMVCIAVAIMITLLPLVFTLFVLFLLLKCLILLIAFSIRHQRGKPRQVLHARRSARRSEYVSDVHQKH
jgi:ABC-type bacteriocin/lantibiotic exporter with double-glycine peptidase domain